MVKIPTVNIESVSIRILKVHNQGPSAKSVYRASGRKNEELFKVYIQQQYSDIWKCITKIL